MARTLVVCPNCGDPDQLSTIERLIGLAGASMCVEEDGEQSIDFEGSTNVDWDSSRTIGVYCANCDWQVEEEAWFDRLARLPDLLTQMRIFLADLDAGIDRERTGVALGALLTDPESPRTDESDGRAIALVVLIPSALREGPECGDELAALYNAVADNADTAATVAAQP